MSRSHREAASGNLKISMRDNYSEHGVEDYYTKVGSTYRNPHFPGIKNCLFLWFNQWWTKESFRVRENGFTVFDMACGSGETTVSLIEWWKTGKALHAFQEAQNSLSDAPRGRVNPFTAPPLEPTFARPTILAADPYTADAFFARTGLYNCSQLAFKDIADGSLPPLPLSSVRPIGESDAIPERTKNANIEMVICSFALHLIASPSELFSLLWELSTRCRWLVVLAPHKKPEIKDGWGWQKWNIDTWSEVSMTETEGEILHARVHCRVYRSLNMS
ncbi:hypothetical protein BDW22DRAFT_1353286 [Trametopsis cervina]|nr:hypothetical protein BDW22DRAFT_1353286 [Trametopsis cervina]